MIFILRVKPYSITNVAIFFETISWEFFFLIILIFCDFIIKKIAKWFE